METEVTAPIYDPKTTAIRASLIGNRITIADAAKAMRVTVRTIYYALKRVPVPYVVCFGTRYYEAADLARALLAEKNTESRGRGRPRKSA